MKTTILNTIFFLQKTTTFSAFNRFAIRHLSFKKQGLFLSHATFLSRIILAPFEINGLMKKVKAKFKKLLFRLSNVTLSVPTSGSRHASEMDTCFFFISNSNLSSSVRDLSGRIRDLSGRVRLLSGYVRLLSGYVRLLSCYVRNLSGRVRLLSGYVHLLSGYVRDLSGNVRLLSCYVCLLSGYVRLLSCNIYQFSGFSVAGINEEKPFKLRKYIHPPTRQPP